MSCPRLWYASSKQNCQVELEDHDHEAEVRQASQVSAANDTGESRHDVDEQFWHSKRHRRKHAARQSPSLAGTASPECDAYADTKDFMPVGLLLPNLDAHSDTFVHPDVQSSPDVVA